MDYCKMQPLCLENLPNELFFHGIFPLFSCEELYHSFFGLNKRINSILQSVAHLDFTINTGNNYHPALSFFAACIESLTVWIGQFDLTPFRALRTLTLRYPSLNQRNSIRPDICPRLKYLSLSYPLEDSVLLHLIFSNAFQHLNECRFDRILTSNSWTGSPRLRSVTVSVHGSYEVVCVLRACPNICRLNIIVYGMYESKLSLPRHSVSCRNLALQHLFIRSEFLLLASILTVTPNLKWLTFKSIQFIFNPEFDFKRLADILTNLHQLSYIYFTLETSAWVGQTSLNTVHPLFRHVQYNNINHTIIMSSSMI